MINTDVIYTSVISAIISNGILLFIGKAVIHELIKEDLKEISRRMDTIEKEYVPCDYCDAQNQNNQTILQSIDSKLEILLEHQLK